MQPPEGGVVLVPDRIEVRGPVEGRGAEVLTRDALEFLAELHQRFDPRRRELLAERAARQRRIDAGELPSFLDSTRSVRESSWRVAPPPRDLEDRRVEITGPVDRKMMINALNSGARCFMADFEDSLSPTWENVVQGHVNLSDAVRRSIEHRNPDGKVYRLADRTATLLVRPRGLHLPERHLFVDGAPIGASFADFGLHFFHNARESLARGTGPYYYLPKLESHLEARLWNDVLAYAEERVGVTRGAARATVLVETILAAFEMEEILWELRERSVGLNAGRWDYLFSIIKKFRNRPGVVLPDRAEVTMGVPFMRSYATQLVRACHRRGAHAIGGMSAFVPNRRDPAVTEAALGRVRDDKLRESADGFDGTWVAHPDLVPVATEVFDAALGSRPNQVHRLREDVRPDAAALLDFRVPGGRVTEAGLRTNVSVGIQYVESWLRGVGAAALHNLMEDAATAEISRSQVWQWVRWGVSTPDGRRIDRERAREVADEEVAKLRVFLGEEAFSRGRFKEAQSIFEEVALDPSFPEFLTLPAYDHID